MTTLADKDIEARMAAGDLIVNGSRGQIGPACYELRMGDNYYDLTEANTLIELSDKGNLREVLIKPGHRVVLITKEELSIPHNIIARVISKGSLFSIGLTPVSTYADPGFRGNLGIVTQNMSDKYITLPIGEPIAKIDFSLLTNESKTPYLGQHGFHTKVWPIRHQLIKNYQDIKNDPRVESEEVESHKILPQATVTALREIKKRQLRVNFYLLTFAVLNSITLTAVYANLLEIAAALTINILSALIFSITMKLADKGEAQHGLKRNSKKAN